MLGAHVECIRVTELDGEESGDLESDGVPRLNAHLFVHVFKLGNVSDCSNDSKQQTCKGYVDSLF